MVAKKVSKLIPFHEGDVIAIPLPKGGYGLGVVSAVPKTRRSLLWISFVWWFGPKWDHVPTIDEVPALKAEDKCLFGLVVMKYVHTGKWPVVGRLPGYNPSQWPMPEFVRWDVSLRRWLRVAFPGPRLWYDQHQTYLQITREEAAKCADSALGGFDTKPHYVERAIEQGWRGREPVEIEEARYS